jgi:hypothetical protein
VALPAPALDISALIAAMERFEVPEAVMEDVSAAVHANVIGTPSDVCERLIDKGTSVVSANRIKDALLAPVSGRSSGWASAPNSRPGVSVNSGRSVRRWLGGIAPLLFQFTGRLSLQSTGAHAVVPPVAEAPALEVCLECSLKVSTSSGCFDRSVCLRRRLTFTRKMTSCWLWIWLD